MDIQLQRTWDRARLLSSISLPSLGPTPRAVGMADGEPPALSSRPPPSVYRVFLTRRKCVFTGEADVDSGLRTRSRESHVLTCHLHSSVSPEG